MSSIVIKGNTSGQVEIAAPDVAGSTTLTLPTGNGTVITTNNIDSNPPAALSTASGSAPSYSARAWVNFNGTGTVAIRASGNVSSITDNGTGNYDVNFTTAMADTNYATVSTCAGLTGMATNRDIWLQAESEATNHTTINSYYRTSQVDVAHCYVAIFR
jgi:hypothetical protein